MSGSVRSKREKPRYVLDTSALIAMIEAEDGGERVRALLLRESVFIPFVALLELRYITQRELGESEADQRYALLKLTRAVILWSMDEPILLTAARLKAAHRISVGDAIVAAFAITEHAVLVHKDPELEALRDELTMETLPFKPTANR